MKELVPEALKAAGGKEKLRRAQALALWKEVAGRELARLTEPLGLEGQTLLVRVADPVTAHGLTYSRLALLRRYEERLPGLVKEIRFLVGPVVLEAPPPSDPPPAPEAAREALRLAQAAPPALREGVARAALALFRRPRGTPCPICGAPSEAHPCPTCGRLLQSPSVRKEAERLKRGRPPRLEGEAQRVAQYLARQALRRELEELYPQALRDPGLRPLLQDLAGRLRALFPEEPLPEAVRSLLG